MNRKAKRTGSGGRLRLGLLMATAAAFLLVPAAAASAATAPVSVEFEGKGAGWVKDTLEPSLPPIECHWDGEKIDIGTSPSEGTGVPGLEECEAEAQESGGLIGQSVGQEADEGSEFVEWEVVEGNPSVGCGTGPQCAAFVFSEAEEIVFKASFKYNVHIQFEGKGSGWVKGAGSGTLAGVPPVECHWNGATEERTGVCDVDTGESVGLKGINVFHEAEGASVFGGWAFEGGSEFGGPGASCAPLAAECFLINASPAITITATLNPPSIPLTRNTGGGTGTGDVNCQVLESGSPVGSPDEPCEPEYPEGTELELTSAPDTGSELGAVSGTNSASGCTTLPCTITLEEPSEVNADFDLEIFTLTVSVTGEGEVAGPGITCTESPASAEECEEDFAYNTNVEVTATPAAENVLASLTGSGSAAGNCDVETGICSFAITADSEVSAGFATANTIDSEVDNVHGEVPETTELASTCEYEEGKSEVDFGEFTPGVTESYVEACGLTVTATGELNSLKAEDESTVDTGHLTQKENAEPHPYSLPKPLETRAAGLGGIENAATPGVFESLELPVTLLTYGGPVGADDVTLFFRQNIGLHDALHTGPYSKTITVTLKQDTP